jgi:two-component system sensor histidine kinase HydH
MGSPAPHKNNSALDGSSRGLFSADMLWVAWVPVLLIGICHYATGAHHHWVHDILRRLYYIPILFAAFSRGLRGGLAVAVCASLTYAPHAFFMMAHSLDPATTLNKLLEIILYNTIGIVAGILADRERGRRLQAERAFADQQRMADQLVRAGRLAALGELVAGIAHEIKNPLHTIKGTVEIVDDIIPKEAEQAGMWNLLRREVDRLERIAERFLSFARPNTPSLTRQEFGGVYERVSELLRAQVHPSPAIDLETTALSPLVEKLIVEVDRDQLAQVVLNISSNALRVLDGKGSIRIGAEVIEENHQRRVALRIENDGPAIAEDELERIFDPFHTNADSGTGLGLAISSRIAEAHGGFLKAENSGEQTGVAFTLILPVD